MPGAPEIPTESAFVLTEAGGTIAAVGGSVTEIFGRTTANLVGRDVATTIGLTVHELREGAARRRLITTTLPPPGTQSPVEVITVNLEPGEMVGVIISPAASTELNRSRDMNQTLAASNRQLEAFASVAAHDLQEPLRKIRAFTDRVRGLIPADPGAQVLDYLDRVDGAAARMQTLISDLLALARISGRTPEREQSNLEQLVRRVLFDLSDQVFETGAVITVGDLPTMTLDPNQFRQLFTNLLSNSLKYRHPDRAPQISISSERRDGYVVITVADNGIGFDDQYLRKIFEPFERLWGRDDYPGTGVGLALCREIVYRHDGTITAHGRPDEGADFIISLPVSTP